MPSPRTIVTATFSKALGCTGGLILGPSHWLDLIREHSGDFGVYTPALFRRLSRHLLPAVMAALEVLRDEPGRLQRLHSNIDKMRGLMGLAGQSPAAPIFSCLENAEELSSRAEVAGYMVPVLKFCPGAPPGDAMLRWMVSSEEHREEDIRTVSAVLRRL